MPPDTSVVILNWNNKSFLEKFLFGIVKHTSSDAEIIIADNASTDDSVEYVQKNFPTVKIICNDSNKGYAGGYNIALSQVTTEFIVLLNSDIQVTENWLKPLITLMKSDSSIGACQPKILSLQSPDTFEYAGAAGGYIDKYGYPFCRGRIFQSLEKDSGQYDDNHEVFWASGACMVVRAGAFKKLQGFDANFFAHMEEIDLCWRMQLAHYKVFYCAASKVFHVGGGSLPKSNPHKTYLNFRNNLLMIYKNSPTERLQNILGMRFILDSIASVRFLFSGSFRDFLAVWKGRRDFNKLKRQYRRDISVLHRSINFSGIIIYPKSILWDYYLCGRKKFSSLNWKGT